MGIFDILHVNASFGNGTIFIHGQHELRINNRFVIKDTKMHFIAISKSYVIIVTDDPDLYNKSVIESYSPARQGNLIAYDLNGKIAWKINDLITDVHYPFNCGHLATAEDIDFFSKWYGVVFDTDHEYYIGLTTAEEHYIIDLTAKQLVARKTVKS